MTVICATDFSDLALEAASVAAALARKLGQKLLLVHANTGSPGGEARSLMQRGAAEALRLEAGRIAQPGLEVEARVLERSLERCVPTLVREGAATLLVTATPRDEDRVVGGGGTVERLVRGAPLPVLVVRSGAALEEWLTGRRPLRVVLGTDGSMAFETARDWVHTLSACGPLELTGAHVFWPPEAYGQHGITPPRAQVEVTPELRTRLEREVRERLAPLAAGNRIDARVRRAFGRVADPLVELAEEAGADLLVVGMHQRRAFKSVLSVAEHVLRLAPMSVGCVPARANVGVHELPSYERILVGMDFSRFSERALAHACALAQVGAELQLLHVTEGPLPAERRAEAESEILSNVPPGAAEKGLSVRVEFAHGTEASEAILAAAERVGADVICVGSHGRSALKRTVLGSISQRVVNHSSRPVLVVRPHDD